MPSIPPINLRHGFNRRGKKSRIYRIWNGIKNRCLVPSRREYPRYGGRGIKLCDEWLRFIPFKDWAFANGYTDSLTIDRERNDGNYEPGNCRWVPKVVNDRNSSRTKLTPDLVREIRSLKLSGLTYRRLAAQFGLTRSGIQAVCERRSWADVA